MVVELYQCVGNEKDVDRQNAARERKIAQRSVLPCCAKRDIYWNLKINEPPKKKLNKYPPREARIRAFERSCIYSY